MPHTHHLWTMLKDRALDAHRVEAKALWAATDKGKDPSVDKLYDTVVHSAARIKAREPFMGKLQLLRLLQEIKGVALQINVNMEVDERAAQYRDAFWDGTLEEEGSPIYDKKLALSQKIVGSIMSSIYAKTVLSQYLVNGRNQVLLVITANERSGFDPEAVLGSKEDDGEVMLNISNEFENKYFYKAEWPQIKERAAELRTLKLTVAISFDSSFKDATLVNGIAPLAAEVLSRLLDHDDVELEFIIGRVDIQDLLSLDKDGNVVAADRDDVLVFARPKGGKLRLVKEEPKGGGGGGGRSRKSSQTSRTSIRRSRRRRRNRRKKKKRTRKLKTRRRRKS